MPETVLRAIVPASDLSKEDGFNEIADKAVVERWNEDILLYFHGVLDQQKFDDLSDRQIVPLLKAISGETRRGFKSTDSLVNANAIVIIAPKAKIALDTLRLVDIKRWFGADESEFKPIEAAFKTDSIHCFHFVHVDEHRIEKAIIFTSTGLIEAELDKCLAGNFLYMVGMRGDTDGTDSAGAAGTSPTTLGLLDQFALGVLYGKKSKPGVTFREALSE